MLHGERKAGPVNDGMTQQWVIKINGAEVGHVGPAESVEIGRKPLRPLADDGTTRVEVPDETRSMSKRHAVFSVADNGAASVRDLASTNGSYIVRADGGLMRLPEQTDFPLPTSPIRMQFGDVPVDFIRIEQPKADEPESAVPDLFDYAVGEVRQEPDAADLSVDDILDLRAGEPTSIFNADKVRQRAQELDAAQYQAFQPSPLDDVSMPITIMPQSSDNDSAPRDLFVDAQTAETVAEPENAWPDDTHPIEEHHHGDSVWKFADGAMSATQGADGEETATLATSGQTQRDVFVNDRNSAENVDDGKAENMVSAAETVNQTMQDTSTGQSEDHIAEPEKAEQEFTPAFEPGSVFERVSQGGFVQPEPTVEVDGMTSDEAKRTTDFTRQFEMARHPQLLPFLAMNPSLYDDLYAWLAAQGDRDVDEALNHNEGYQEYRDAVGK